MAVLDDIFPVADEPPVGPAQVELSVGCDKIPDLVDEPIDVDLVDTTPDTGPRSIRWTMGHELSSVVPDDDRWEPMLAELRERYLDWLGEDVYLHMREHDRRGKLESDILVKAAKRGNDVNQWRVVKRLEPLYDQFGALANIDTMDGRGETNILFFSMTTALGDDTLMDVWKGHPVSYDDEGKPSRWAGGVSDHWNRFMSWIRKRFGKVAEIRTWEAHKNGMPHVHALLVFHDHTFPIFRHHGTKGSAWRLQSREMKDEMARHWPPGFIDVEGVVNPGRGLEYVLKYVVGHGKGRDEGGIDAHTLSLTWVFGLRQYGVSGVDLIRSCITQTIDLGTVQITIEGTALDGSKWSYLGVVAVLSHGDRPPPWTIDLSGRPDLVAQAKIIHHAHEGN